MFYIVYKITNQIDGKFYIGSHKTKDLNDNYMGSGKYLKRAIDKYGVDNFTKEVLYVFETPEEMYAKEAEIVNEDFLATENTYNLKIGGFGGWDYINANDKLRVDKNRKARMDANAVGAQQKANQRHTDARNNYNLDPKKCGCCGIAIPYDRRKNKYCSSSCAAKINNLGVSRNKNSISR